MLPRGDRRYCMHGTAVLHKRKFTTTMYGVYNNNGAVMNPSANTLPKAQYTNRSKQAEVQ